MADLKLFSSFEFGMKIWIHYFGLFFVLFIALHDTIVDADDTYSRTLPKPAVPLTYCVDNYHVHGKWVFNNSSTLQKSFLCCGWDYHDYAWNTTACAPAAAQDSDFYVGLTGSQGSLVGGHACTCDEKYGRYMRLLCSYCFINSFYLFSL